MIHSSYATTKDLITALSAGYPECLKKAYHLGWLEQQDLLDPSAPLERRHLARILHQFLLSQGEPDAEDVSSSFALKDLYDCRSCAVHIMQIYAKGIMNGYHLSPSLYLFNGKEHVTLEELDEILKRIYHPEYRIRR